MRIIGYTYEADAHCITCVKARQDAGAFKRDPQHCYARPGLDWNGVPYDAVDNEGNIIHPIFSTDEAPAEGEYCGDCHGVIREPWGN